ncbi:MAG: hypothetical protein U0401_15175 [Anaerolineae bacterium]
MTKSTVIEVDFCYSFGKTVFRYQHSRQPQPADLTHLDQYSKAELLGLIGQMVDYEPDLEMFLEPLEGERESEPALSHQKVIKRQVCHAFLQAAGKWNAAYALSLKLLDLVKVGDQYLQEQHWPTAVMIYTTLITEILEHRDLVDDHEGDLANVISRCVTGLHHCFKATTDRRLRQTILDTLARTAFWDVDEQSVKLIR